MDTYFDTWKKAQDAWFENIIETTKRTQQLFLNPQNSNNGLQDFYSSWFKAAWDSLSSHTTSDERVIKDGLAKVLGSTNAYLKLYEMWLPLLKACSDKTLNPDAYQALIDPTRHKELLDKVFGFDPEATKLMLEQASKLLALYTGSFESASKPWADAANASLGVFPNIAEGHPEAVLKIFHSLFTAFENTAGRAFHVPPVGKDREKVELLLRGFDDLSVYAAKNTEYQHMVYSTGLVAMEKVIVKLADKVQSGEEIKQFDEFFDIWVDVNEQAYFQLFQTEDFSRLQAELLDAGLNVRQHFFKIMEMQFYDLPLVLRSEMDDLYKTVYDLKRKVRTLEQQVKETAL
jgi:hypothetical protein